MDNYQAQRLMLRVAILGEYEGPIDGKPTEFYETTAPSMPEPAPAGSAKSLANSDDSTADKVFMPTPWVKPPRRKPFNETSTRGWRREYEREYRANHGDT